MGFQMLVYGDSERTELPSTLCAAISAGLAVCETMPSGRPRHEMLVRCFLLASELVQGQADREFEASGADDLSAIGAAGARLLLGLARATAQSWQSGFSDLSIPSEWRGLLRTLGGSQPIRVKRPEGYSFYALYPESYVAAADISGLGPDSVVIGLRSIGVGLAALVASTLGANPAYSLRPVGHPFDRRIAVTQDLTARILANKEAHFAVVDEGPGLSGSSFGCAADWLEGNGIAPDRIHFFPSHAGDLGPQANARNRLRWAKARKHVTGMDELLLNAAEPARDLRNWVGDLVGAPIRSWQDISGGAWRDAAEIAPACWPPSDTQKEKRKFLALADDCRWLVKFAGLGETGAEKEGKASLLSKAGFTPDFGGLCHGFLVEKWIEGQSLERSGVARGDLIEHLGRYLGFRARHLPSGTGGASLEELRRMAVFNTGEALGRDAAARLEAILGDVSRLAGLVCRVDTDNRLHAWEWLVDADGHIIKTDALDHSSAHDLIGCQDISWDIAGAGVEFDLTVAERSHLAETVAREADCEPRQVLLTLFEFFYLGFQIGLWTDATQSQAESEASRTASRARYYVERMKTLIRSQ